MQSLKMFSARSINKEINKKGILRQDESYDHIVRSEKELYNIIEYVINNPVDEWKLWKYTYLNPKYNS